MSRLETRSMLEGMRITPEAAALVTGRQRRLRPQELSRPLPATSASATPAATATPRRTLWHRIFGRTRHGCDS